MDYLVVINEEIALWGIDGIDGMESIAKDDKNNLFIVTSPTDCIMFANGSQLASQIMTLKVSI